MKMKVILQCQEAVIKAALPVPLVQLVVVVVVVDLIQEVLIHQQHPFLLDMESILLVQFLLLRK